MTPRRGSVWYQSREVGRLEEGTGRLIRFSYLREWLEGGGFPVSIRLPLELGTEDVEAHAYFQGLLPEGGARLQLARQHRIAADDDFGLLLAAGEDIAGAFCILPDGVAPGQSPAPPIEIGDDALRSLVRSQGASLPEITGRPRRFSLAGAQAKLPVIYAEGRYSVPDRDRPSTHILKFETIPRVCLAELAAARLAAAAGLQVAEAELLSLDSEGGPVPYLRIERYDRAPGTGSAGGRRLHQEDACQALGIPSALKYERDGGPSLGDVAGILRDHARSPALDLMQLRDWQMFNCLAGNWDGHGKNLSLLYPDGANVPGLAPFYDLVAIEFLNLLRPHGFARELAMKIGGQDIPERITRGDWESCARDLDMPARPFLARLEELAATLPALAADVRDGIARDHGELPALATFEESIKRRCDWTLRSVIRGAG